MGVEIRAATLSDAKEIARIHVDTWRAAYRGIVPGEYLAGLSYAESQEMWRRIMGSEQAACVLETLYVLPSRQGEGIGRRLVGAIAGRLAEIGVSSMLLWVLAENKTARRFYESLGGTRLGEGSFELGGAELSEVAYGWKDLSILQRSAAED